jgi:hypothetical protein
MLSPSHGCNYLTLLINFDMLTKNMFVFGLRQERKNRLKPKLTETDTKWWEENKCQCGAPGMIAIETFTGWKPLCWNCLLKTIQASREIAGGKQIGTA